MSLFEKSLDKMKQRQLILAMLTFAFVAVIVWIGISLFTSQKKTGISSELLKLSKPLTPSINEEVVDQIRQKRIYYESQLKEFPIYMVSKNRDNLEEIVDIHYEPEPSPSPSPSPSPEIRAQTRFDENPSNNKENNINNNQTFQASESASEVN